MPSHRSQRMAEAIREVVSEGILFHVSDPRVRSVTVLRAELSGDLRNATIYVSVMGTDSERRLALRGLQSASGFLQSRVAARLQTRFTPMLSFKLDESVRRSVEMSRLIEDALAADRERSAQRGADQDAADLEDVADDEVAPIDEPEDPEGEEDEDDEDDGVEPGRGRVDPPA